MIINILILFGLGLTGLKAQTMNVFHANGTHTSYFLNDVRHLTFSNNNIVVTTHDNSKEEFVLNELKYLNFDITSTNLIKQGHLNNLKLDVYPNPVIDLLNIDLSGISHNQGMLKLISIDGKVLFCQEVKEEGILEVNVSGLQKGVYICLFSNSAEIQRVKFIKQ